MVDAANPILLYDGVCGLCNRFVQFTLKHDGAVHFRFASLQSGYAARILHARGLNPQDLDTIYVIDPPNARLLARSDAVIFMLHKLGGFWRAASVALGIFPKKLRDWGYRAVARRRYRVFGKYESCLLPDQKYRDRFLDL